MTRVGNRLPHQPCHVIILQGVHHVPPGAYRRNQTCLPEKSQLM